MADLRAPDAAPEAHLLLLPTEVITTILEQLAAAGDYLAVCRAASSCVVLRAAASSAWKAAVEAALLPAAWRGAPPSSWQQCARDAFEFDGAEWLEFAPRLRKPTFAHTAVEHGGAIYVFGGRDAANYSNRVHALELRDGRCTRRPKRSKCTVSPSLFRSLSSTSVIAATPAKTGAGSASTTS